MRALCLALLLVLWSADASAARRIAVVVGTDAAAPGRQALRYSRDDAESVAQTLLEVAEFAPEDIDLLLDPAPEAVLAALDRRLESLRSEAGETLLLFYYSGHADNAALYPGGSALPVSELKRRLSDRAASVRVGIVDACRGGAWTGSKGLTPAAEFEVEVPLVLGSEGSVLLSASSGLGDAHESELIGGSFFTHHLVAALRGAGDRSGDGEVTLLEAFEYAQQLTVRDSALVAGVPQRPSFEMNLRGRRDLPLSRVTSSPNQVSLEQDEGPLQLIRLDTGLVVLEVPAGPRRVVAGLPAGRYLVRRRTAAGTLAREIELHAGTRLEVREGELESVESATLTKGAAAPQAATLAAGDWALQLAMGRVITGQEYTGRADAELGGVVDLRVGITDRLQVSPAFLGAAYRFGVPEAAEVVGWTQSGWGWNEHALAWNPRVGAELRLHAGAPGTLLAGVSAESLLWKERRLDSWLGGGHAGWKLQLGEKVTLAAGAAVGRRFEGTREGWESGILSVEFGSLMRAGATPLPIASVELLDRVTLDGYASVRLDERGGVYESFLGGATWMF